jgi:hypothetical protein
MRTNITFSWTFPTQHLSTNVLFKFYSSTNLTLPVTNWPLYATKIGTNTTVTLPIDAQQRWFVLTASNWWGETDFSNVAGTQPILPSESTVMIGP